MLIHSFRSELLDKVDLLLSKLGVLEEHREDLAEVFLRDKTLLLGVKDLESLLCRNVGRALQGLIESLNDCLSLFHLALTDNPLRPYVLEHFLLSLHPVILVLVAILEVLEVVEELVE